MEILCNIEVVIYEYMMIPFFSQGRAGHSAVVLRGDTIIIVGGFDANFTSLKTGEIVKSKFALENLTYIGNSIKD